VSSAAWVTITFGAQVTVVHPPATVPSQVSQLRADDSDHVIVDAIARADTVIGLSDPAMFPSPTPSD